MKKTLENIIHYLPDYKGVTLIFGSDNVAENEVVEIEKYYIAEAFETYGGSFLQAIGLALHRADVNNTEKLLETFEDEVKEYIVKFILNNKEK